MADQAKKLLKMSKFELISLLDEVTKENDTLHAEADRLNASLEDARRQLEQALREKAELQTAMDALNTLPEEPEEAAPVGFAASSMEVDTPVRTILPDTGISPLDEAAVLRTAYTYEQSQSFHKEMAEVKA